MLLTAALGLAAIASETEAGHSFRKAELEAMSTKELARAVLPPNPAEVVISHRLVPGLFPGANYGAIEFLTPAGPIAPNFEYIPPGRPVASNFCRRSRYYVTLQPAAGLSHDTLTSDAPARVTDILSSQQIAYATDCVDVPAFAHINSGDVPMAMDLLSFLAGLREKARRSTELAVKVDCATDLEDDSCQAGAVARLANLPIEQAFIIHRPSRLEGSRWKWRISIPEIPGAAGPYAEVNLDDDPSCATEIEIRRKIPAPF